MERYLEIKERHQKEFETLPIFWAFNNKQFEEGMKNFGLTIENTDKICKIPWDNATLDYIAMNVIVRVLSRGVSIREARQSVIIIYQVYRYFYFVWHNHSPSRSPGVLLLRFST